MVVGQAGNGVEAVRTAKRCGPDVIVMDVMMPEKDGIDACRDIADVLPDTRVLMLTASSEEDAVIEAIAAGARGYLQKYSGREELIAAVRDVAEGRLLVPGDTLRRVFASIRGSSERERRRGPRLLTKRERDILTSFASGKPYRQIAEVEGNSPITIRNAIYRIQDKLGVSSKQEIVAWAVRNGLLEDINPGS